MLNRIIKLVCLPETEIPMLEKDLVVNHFSIRNSARYSFNKILHLLILNQAKCNIFLNILPSDAQVPGINGIMPVPIISLLHIPRTEALNLKIDFMLYHSSIGNSACNILTKLFTA